MKAKRRPDEPPALRQTWTLPYTVTLGSSVRARGIFLEIRAHLSPAAKKSLKISGAEITLGMPEGADAEFQAAVAVVAKTVAAAEKLPVIPREIQDILSITATERHRWLKDGRLQSAGTRSVKLRGRAKKVTFHVFDLHVVEDVLDRGLVQNWREQDAITAAENRRRAAWKAKLTRAQKTAGKSEPQAAGGEEDSPSKLQGWDEFERTGLLR